MRADEQDLTQKSEQCEALGGQLAALRSEQAAMEAAARKAANDLKAKSDALCAAESSAQVRQKHMCKPQASWGSLSGFPKVG